MVEAVISLLFFLGIFYGLTWVMGLVAFSPLNERTLLFQVSARFRISDVMILALHIQVLVAFLMAIARNSGPTDAEFLSEIWFVCANLCALVAFWWLNGLRMLGRGGVNNTWHRWVFLGLVVPIGYTCGILAIMSFFMLPFSIAALVRGPDVNAIAFTVALSLSWPGLYAINRLSRKFVKRARIDRAEDDGIHFSNDAVFAPSPNPQRTHRPYRSRS